MFWNGISVSAAAKREWIYVQGNAFTKVCSEEKSAQGNLPMKIFAIMYFGLRKPKLDVASAPRM